VDAVRWTALRQTFGLPDPRLAFRSFVGDQIRTIQTPRQLVIGRFAEGSLCIVYGQSGTTKTFLSVDLALSLATGTAWMGARVPRPVHVVYALAEGASAVKIRVDAWVQRRRDGLNDAYADKHVALTGHPSIPDTFELVPDRIDVMSREHLRALREHIEPRAPKAVFIDTWKRHGGPEDEDLAQAIANIDDEIRKPLGCAVFIVHHTPKNGDRTIRGYADLDMAADTTLFVSYVDDEKQDVARGQFEQRDLEPGEDIYYRKQSVVMPDYPDADTGVPRTTLLLEPCENPRRVERKDSKKQRADDIEKAVVAFVSSSPGCTVSSLRDVLGRNKQAVKDAIASLIARGVLQSKEGEQQGARRPVYLSIRQDEM
jgi:hypothetical protein